jgi:addiction module HigA family antidote
LAGGKQTSSAKARLISEDLAARLKSCPSQNLPETEFVSRNSWRRGSLTGEMTMPKSKKLLSPIHPGEILRADFMEPLRLSMNRLALDLRVPVTRISEIVHERRGITPDTALRLARYFNTSASFWLNLQSAYDLEVAQDKFSRIIEREVHPAAEVLRG